MDGIESLRTGKISIHHWFDVMKWDAEQICELLKMTKEKG